MSESEQQPTSASQPGRAAPIEHQCLELCPICRTADVVRATLPPEFHEHWNAFQREALLALRTALDHYIAQVEDRGDDEPPVEDIPIA